jgi:hypothetical protein
MLLLPTTRDDNGNNNNKEIKIIEIEIRTIVQPAAIHQPTTAAFLLID